MLTQIDETELRDILETTPPEQNIMIAGKHGIGKSKIVENYFTAKGKKVVVFFCSQAADPGDIIGLPHYNPSTGKTEFALPWWFPTPPTDKDGNPIIDEATGRPLPAQPVVLFLDELNRARPEILQTVMDLTLNRKLAGKSLPPGSQIISAINNGDEYQLTDLDPALVSRFNVYSFSPSVNDWIKWANAHGLDTRVVSFIATNTKFLDPTYSEDSTSLDKTPDRRAWERVSDIIKNTPVIKPGEDKSLKKMLCGIVGASAAVAFYESIIKNVIVTPEDLLSDFESCRGTLAGYKLQDLVALNDNICSYIESTSGEIGENDQRDALYAKNLCMYFDFLVDPHKGNSEAFSHFISDYDTGSYPKLNYLTAVYSDTLEKRITDFLTKTRTI